jgi:hypothetical protein
MLGRTKDKSNRSKYDYYITPDIAVIELLKREKFDGLGWEPACGNGAISKFFKNIINTDIRPNIMIGDGGIDFLKYSRQVDYIITNPPHSLSLAFARHALECASKVALYLSIEFLESKKRYEFFRQNPPIRIYVFSNRVPYGIEVNGKVEWHNQQRCDCWFIWEKGFKGSPTLDWVLCDT